MKIEDEIRADVASNLTLTRAQQHQVLIALESWVRSRAQVPDTDPRLWALMKILPSLVENLRLELDATSGLTAVMAQERGLPQVALLLERGTAWLQGGDWKRAVVASLS